MSDQPNKLLMEKNILTLKVIVTTVTFLCYWCVYGQNKIYGCLIVKGERGYFNHTYKPHLSPPLIHMVCVFEFRFDYWQFIHSYYEEFMYTSIQVVKEDKQLNGLLASCTFKYY